MARSHSLTHSLIHSHLTRLLTHAHSPRISRAIYAVRFKTMPRTCRRFEETNCAFALAKTEVNPRDISRSFLATLSRELALKVKGFLFGKLARQQFLIHRREGGACSPTTENKNISKTVCHVSFCMYTTAVGPSTTVRSLPQCNSQP